MDDLSSFFSAVSVGKKKIKEETSAIVGDSFETLFWEELTKSKKSKKNKKTTEEKCEIVEEIKEEVSQDFIQEIVEEPKSKLIERSLGLLSEPSNIKQQKDPLTPLDQQFVTVDDLNKHYKLFLARVQQQLSTLGGGGETRLEFLDDVDRNSVKTDNYFLKYNASLNKWVGDPADGVGITSIVSITGVTTFYQATDTDDYIGVNSNVPVTIVLPEFPSIGKKLIIKDEGNKINTYNITVQSGIGKSVENDSSVIMDINHQSLTYFYNGNNWFIV